MACPQRGRKRESSGYSRQKRGTGILPGERFQDIPVTKSFEVIVAGVSGTNRCYEPAGMQFVAAIPKAGVAMQGVWITIS
jgi:hypothetical protein